MSASCQLINNSLKIVCFLKKSEFEKTKQNQSIFCKISNCYITSATD